MEGGGGGGGFERRSRLQQIVRTDCFILSSHFVPSVGPKTMCERKFVFGYFIGWAKTPDSPLTRLGMKEYNLPRDSRSAKVRTFC